MVTSTTALPVMLGVVVSVAVIVWSPVVANVTLTMAMPFWNVAVAGITAEVEVSVLVSFAVPL